MTLRHSTIVISAAALAFLVCSSGTLKAQTPTDTPRATNQTDIRQDDDSDWGWLGLLGLAGLGGLAGRRERDHVVATRRAT